MKAIIVGFLSILAYFGSVAAPQSLPTSSIEALRAYALDSARSTEAWLSTGISGETDGQSWIDTSVTGGALSIINSLAGANLTIGIIDPKQKVTLRARVYDSYGSVLFRGSSMSEVVLTKGGYTLSNPSVQLKLESETLIDFGEKVYWADLVITNGNGQVEHWEQLDEEGNGFYFPSYLIGMGFIQVQTESGQYTYGPDGTLITPTPASVEIAVSIEGVMMFTDQSVDVIVQSDNGWGINPTIEFTATQHLIVPIRGMTSNNLEPVGVCITHPDGRMEKRLYTPGGFVLVALSPGRSYIHFDWGGRLLPYPQGGKG